MLAQLCEPSNQDRPKYPLLQLVQITADAILQYKGIQRWGFERQAMYEWIQEEMGRLQALHFDISNFWARDPKTGQYKGVDWKKDRLFDIVDVTTYQETFFGKSEPIETSWSVRAGQWAYYWLNASGRVWVGKMAKVLLELDHREQRGPALLAKRSDSDWPCLRMGSEWKEPWCAPSGGSSRNSASYRFQRSATIAGPAACGIGLMGQWKFSSAWECSRPSNGQTVMVQTTPTAAGAGGQVAPSEGHGDSARCTARDRNGNARTSTAQA